MTIADLQKRAWQTSEDHGFHETPDVGLPTRLMLIVSELAEALEEDREGYATNKTYFNTAKPDKPEGVPIELADAVIRILDLSEVYGIDLEQAILDKMDYNDTRPFKHGGKAY